MYLRRSCYGPYRAPAQVVSVDVIAIVCCSSVNDVNTFCRANECMHAAAERALAASHFLFSHEDPVLL